LKLLLTGASGFIGHNVLLRAPRSWEVVALCHQTAGLEDFVRAQGLSHVRVERCDLLDERAVQALAGRIGRPTAMLYLAANGDPAASAERPRWDLDSNTAAFVTTLEHCRADHVVCVSSGAVSDGLKGAVSPASPVSPRLPYAISKLASEQYLRFFVERRQTVSSYVNVRFFGAYGPYEAPRKITTKWLEAIRAGQREFVIRGNGQNLIDFMYVDDAVDGFLAVTAASGTRATEDFASGSPISVNDVVQLMAKVSGAEVSVRHEGTVAEFIEFRSTDATMRETFGCRPQVSFESGLQRLRAFLSEGDHAHVRRG